MYVNQEGKDGKIRKMSHLIPIAESRGFFDDLFSAETHRLLGLNAFVGVIQKEIKSASASYVTGVYRVDISSLGPLKEDWIDSGNQRINCSGRRISR